VGLLLEAAMASRAYGDGAFVTEAFDAADPNIRGLAGGMTDASGAWMKMRDARAIWSYRSRT
jgi:hypothetical protein